MDPRARRGRLAEDLVARRLEQSGFDVVARNLRLGRLEVDLVAINGPLMVVCEVRSRSRSDYGNPAESVVGPKAERIRRAAAMLLAENRWNCDEVRIDVAAVTFGPGDTQPDIHYYAQAL